MRGEQRVVVLAVAAGEHPHRATDDAVLEGRLTTLGDRGAAIECIARAAQAPIDRSDHLHRVQARAHLQLRSETHFQIAHALGLVVLGEFRGNAFERFRIVHRGDRVPEALQVFAKTRVAVLEHGLAQSALGVARHFHFVLACQLDQRPEAQ